MARRPHYVSEKITARLLVLPTAVALAAVLPVAPAHAATVTDLGTGFADVMNDRGQIAGHFTTPSGEGHAFVWTAGSGRVDIGSLGGTLSWVSAINEQGQVAGYSMTASGDWHAFRWTPSATMRDLGTLGGHDSFARAMNSRGEVVGSSTTVTGDRHAFIWTPSGGMQDLGAGVGQADDINDNGQVVGSLLAEPGFPSVSHLFLWSRSSGVLDLGRPDVPVEDSHFSVDGVINESGQVAGTYSNALDTYGAFRWTRQDGFELLAAQPGNTFDQVHSINRAGMAAGIYGPADAIHAFRWTAQGGLQDLGIVSDDWHEHGTWMVNDQGDVAGTTYDQAGSRRLTAVLWTPASGMQALGTLGGDWSAATTINAHGQVAGWSTATSGDIHAVLWSP